MICLKNHHPIAFLALNWNAKVIKASKMYTIQTARLCWSVVLYRAYFLSIFFRCYRFVLLFFLLLLLHFAASLNNSKWIALQACVKKIYSIWEYVFVCGALLCVWTIYHLTRSLCEFGLTEVQAMLKCFAF